MEADQRTTEMEKRLMDVVAPLVADREPAVLRKPGQCALHHPPVPTQLAAALYALSCYAALYPALSQGSFAFSIVVGFVGMQLLGTLPRPSPTGTLAALSTTASGMPLRSETRWRLVPFFPLSVGFAAVFGPPFWPGWKPNLVRLAPTLSGRLLRGGPEGLGAASPTPQPLATRVSVASKSCPIRMPSLGAASPRGYRSLARRRYP